MGYLSLTEYGDPIIPLCPGEPSEPASADESGWIDGPDDEPGQDHYYDASLSWVCPAQDGVAVLPTAMSLLIDELARGDPEELSHIRLLANIEDSGYMEYIEVVEGDPSRSTYIVFSALGFLPLHDITENAAMYVGERGIVCAGIHYDRVWACAASPHTAVPWDSIGTRLDVVMGVADGARGGWYKMHEDAPAFLLEKVTADHGLARYLSAEASSGTVDEPLLDTLTQILLDVRRYHEPEAVPWHREQTQPANRGWSSPSPG